VIPVLVVTGPIGVGKTTVLLEIDELLIAAGARHVTVELEDVARCWTVRQLLRESAWRITWWRPMTGLSTTSLARSFESRNGCPDAPLSPRPGRVRSEEQHAGIEQ
jgi:hypothetical protein